MVKILQNSHTHPLNVKAKSAPQFTANAGTHVTNSKERPTAPRKRSLLETVLKRIKRYVKDTFTGFGKFFGLLVALTSITCSRKLQPIATLLLLAGTGSQLGKLCSELINPTLNRDSQSDEPRYYQARKHFGNAFLFLAFAIINLPHSAAFAAETRTLQTELRKLSNQNFAPVKQAVEKSLEAALTTLNGSKKQYITEHAKLFFTPEGWHALWAEFNPARLYQQLKKTLSHLYQATSAPPPIIDIQAHYNRLAQALGMASEEIPTLCINGKGLKTDAKELIVQSKASYLAKNHEINICYATTWEELIAEYSSSNAPFKNLIVSLDKSLPQWVKNYLLHQEHNNLMKKYYLDNLLTHELTHAQQQKRLAGITTEQAESYLTQLLQDRPEHTNIPNFEKTDLQTFKQNFIETCFQETSGEQNASSSVFSELTSAQQKYIAESFKGYLDNALLATPSKSNWFNYLTTPIEIEARLAGLQQQQKALIHHLEAEPKRLTTSQTLDNIRDLVLEEKSNTLLQQLSPGALQTAEPKKIREQLKQLSYLTAEGPLTIKNIRELN